jgi:hypothetical protein
VDGRDKPLDEPRHDGGIMAHRIAAQRQHCTTGRSRMRAMRERPVVLFCRNGQVLIYGKKLDANPKSEA